MNRLPAVLTFLMVCLAVSSVFAQSIPTASLTINYDTIRIASYNILNYPNASSTRDPYLRRVVHTMKPDILVVQEMTTSAGVTAYLNNVLNYYQAGLYSTIAFNNGPDTDNHLYFKSSKVSFVSTSYISTALRDIAEYVVRILGTKDTIRLYSLHLKASQGYEEERFAEATILRNHLNSLSAGSKFMVLGDYNIYTSTEAAFQKLIGSEADNDGRCKDPINEVGNWHDNSAFEAIHTQSPRVRALSDGGSTGGMDDRFDMILTSYSSLDNNIIVSSYTAYGNDGNHINDSINKLPNTAVPDSVAHGLHYGSDHIPVFCNFKFENTAGTFALLSPSNGATGQSTSGTLRWQSSVDASAYDVYLDQNNTPTTLISSDQTDTTYNYSTLTAGATYYWKVIAKNGSNSTTATGSPWNFSTTATSLPGSFSLLTPSNGALNQYIAGTLTWQSSANAASYDVYLGTTNPPTTIVSANQVGTSYDYSGLSNSTTYYWKIVAKNAYGTTDATSSPWSFNTIIAPPAAFSLLSPSNGAINQSVSGSLSWEVSSNATGYDVYLDVNNPPNIKVSSEQSDTSYDYSGLLNNTTYYWKVVAKNFIDSTVASDSVRSFTTIVAAPSTFLLASPSDGAIDQPLAGILSWNLSTSAASYDVYLDVNNPPIEKVDSNVISLSFNYSNIQGGTTYYWKVVAKNIAGEITASNSPRHFTTLNVPTAPSDITSVSITETSLQITWTDNATNELGYRIYRSLSLGGPYSQVDGDLPPNTTTFNDTGLAVNSKYYYRVIPFNNVGEGSYAQIALNTLAVIPGKSNITVLNHNSLTVVVNPSVNPSSTQFAIMGSVNDTDFYVQQNGSLQSDIFWQTYTEWGGAVGINVINLQSCQVYSFRVKARNGEDIETQFSDTSMAQLSCNVMTYQASIGWNLLSVPIGGTDTRKSTLFPTSTSDAFAYVGAYTAQDTLSSGCGYWLKFNSLDAVNLIGDLVSVDTIDLNPGWNLIGSVSSPVRVSSIVSEPAGIITSGYYRYEGVYMLSDSIHPMRGYWVKANSTGKIILSSSTIIPKEANDSAVENVLIGSHTFVFEDLNGNQQNLYLVSDLVKESERALFVLPPTPPNDGFDVRFKSQGWVEYVDQKSSEQQFHILIQSPTAVKMSWNLVSPNQYIQLVDGHDTYNLQGMDYVIVNKVSNNLILKVKNLESIQQPNEFMLYQNYPNPFNPSTTVQYQIPTKSLVRLSIYNSIGAVVSDLDVGIREGGKYSVMWSPETASGVYYVRLDATNLQNPQEVYHSVKKTTYLK